MNRRLNDLSNYEDIDLLFLGSSHAYRGFDTRIFKDHGLVSFNLGSSSQTPIQTEVLLEKYIHILNPKLVVYEVYPGTFSIDGVESTIDIISNDSIDIHLIKMIVQLKNIKLINVLVYKTVRDLLGLDKYFSESVLKGDDTYIAGGFVEKKMAYWHPVERKNTENWNLLVSQTTAFERIISFLKKNKTNFILVQAPVSRELYESYKNESEIDHYFSTYGNYYNFNNLLSLNSSEDFFDSQHLNQNGVRIFNDYLIDIIENNLNCDSRRTVMMLRQ